VVQLTIFSALSLVANPRIGRSDARASSVTSFTSFVLAHGFVRCNNWRRLAASRMQVLEVSFAVLSEMVGGPT
jgi:hypothetical protein